LGPNEQRAWYLSFSFGSYLLSVTANCISCRQHHAIPLAHAPRQESKKEADGSNDHTSMADILSGKLQFFAIILYSNNHQRRAIVAGLSVLWHLLNEY
jgi:hypothetical protein